jgi:hypothetical protein
MKHITATMAFDQQQTTSMDEKKRQITHHETRWSMGVKFGSGGVSVSAAKVIEHRLGRGRRMGTSTGSAALIPIAWRGPK